MLDFAISTFGAVMHSLIHISNGYNNFAYNTFPIKDLLTLVLRIKCSLFIRINLSMVTLCQIYII